MNLFQRLNPSSLSPHDLQIWLELTPSTYHYYFQGQTRYQLKETFPIMVGAFQEDKLVGMALATHDKHSKVADLEFLFVMPLYRNHKIATELLLFLERELIKDACMAITMVYPANEPTTPVLEKLMQNSGWEKPSLFMIRCNFNVAEFNPPWYLEWLQNTHKLTNEMQVFPWRELKLLEKNQLYHQQQQGRIPAEVFPFKNLEKIEFLNSLGLRYKQEVIGWMITHRINPEMICYSSLYIHKEYKFLGCAINLLCQAIYKQKQAGIPFGMMEIYVKQVRPAWMSFVKRRLLPHATAIITFRQAWREFKLS